MNKNDLIAQVASETGLPKSTCEKVATSIFDSIVSCLTKGDKFTYNGFGSFSTKNRKEREGRNPSTGAKIKIPATTVASFSPSSNLKEVLNKKKK